MEAESSYRDLAPHVETSPSSVVQGRSIVATVGIDNYDHWPRLRNAANDALGFARLLIEKLGFIELVPPLLDRDATKSGILHLTDDRLRDTLTSDDQLLFLFAGHGHTRTLNLRGKPIEEGFLIPVEAKAGSEMRWSDLIEIDSLLRTIGTLPAQHILVILDSCHSGFALGSSMRSYRSQERYRADLASRVSRKVITSARRDQLALDSGPVANHSLFAGTAIQGIDWGRADLDGNGLITSSELGLYLQQEVGQSSGSRQTPDYGSFHHDDRGEMVISLNSETFDAIKARALAALQQGEFVTFRQLALRASGLRPSSPEGLYLSYRLRLIDGDIPGALDAIARLRGSDLEKGKIPLSDNELENLSIRLPFWRSVLAIPEGGFPLVVTALAGDDARELSALALNAIESIPESLEVAEPRPIGEVRGIVIPESSNLLFAFHNPEPTGPEAGPGKTYYVYMIYIDPEGRITPASLWSSRVLWEGLPPGRGGTSNPFRQTGTFGLAEIRFFSSPELIPEFLSPPDVGARSIFAELQLDADQVEAMRMHRVYFKMER